MPGLIEPHAHLSFPELLSPQLTTLPPEEHMLITVRNARTMLDSGYTSAFSAAAAKPRLDVVLRREIDAGRVPGPRLLANGPELTVTGGLGDTNVMHLTHHETPTFCWIVDGPDEMRRACRTLAREGVDLLKLNISGDQGTSRAGVGAHGDERRGGGGRHGGRPRRATSGSPATAAARTPCSSALRHGVDVIYHANYADERALDALEAARDRVFVAPALGITWALCHTASPWGITPEVARARGLERELEISVETMARMRKRGIRVLPGGDYGFPYTPHGAYARDLWLFVKVLGLLADGDAGRGHAHGRRDHGPPRRARAWCAEGALADLLLVDGDPLADIEVLQDHDAIRMIMKDGVLHKSP